jgi:hypothetical protein
MRALLAGLLPLAILAIVVARAQAAPTMQGRMDTLVRRHVDRPSPRDASRKHGDGRPLLGPRTTRYAVTFQHLHTRELLPIALRVPEERLSSFLRCRASGDERSMDPVPMGVALRLARRFGAERVEIISGFRSPKLNERLRKKGHEVASDSQHTRGTALDFRVVGVPAVELARAAGEVHTGGIGTYRESDFIHVDTGRDRRWSGR